jgi:hypothetical protein
MIHACLLTPIRARGSRVAWSPRRGDSLALIAAMQEKRQLGIETLL